MSDNSIFVFGMFVFAVAIGSSLITVLGGNVTPVEQPKPSEKKNGIVDTTNR